VKQYRIRLGDQVFDVKVLDDPRREQVRVQVDGETFTVGVEAASPEVELTDATVPPRGAPSPAGQTPAPSDETASDSTVTAPLPGVIKSIAVRPGQRVAPDDALVTIEAMKMDNVIRATHASIVGTIHVNEGRQVAYGEPLLDLKSEG
jgi:biotin carboxyl carrier protein